MAKLRLTLIALLFITVIYSCKKQAETTQEKEDENIILTETPNRVDLTNQGTVFNFEQVGGTTIKNTNATQAQADPYPYVLEYNGKVESLKDANNNALSAMEVTSSRSRNGVDSNVYAICYMTGGSNFGGGADIIRLQKNGNINVTNTVKTPKADVTNIAFGGRRLYLGMDMGNYESQNLKFPAAIGVLRYDVYGRLIKTPDIIGLKGYSVQDLIYNTKEGDAVYVATAENGGFTALDYGWSETLPVVKPYQPYPGLRSLTINDGRYIIASTSSHFSLISTSAFVGKTYAWEIPNDDVKLGSVSTLSNSNLLFGNNYNLIHVDVNSGATIDKLDVGGWITSINVLKDKIYITTGNSLLVGAVQNGHIKIIAKTHFASVFGGSFVVNNSFVDEDKVFVTCGTRGTYVFTLKSI